MAPDIQEALLCLSDAVQGVAISRLMQNLLLSGNRTKHMERRHHAQYVRAVLVLIRAWLAAGRPAGKRTLGSFESWAAVVGGILEHAEVPGFLHDTEELYESADAEGQEWCEFVRSWWDKFRPRWVSAGELLDLALERDLLGSIVRDKSQRGQKIRLGKALSSARDRHFAHYRLVAGRNSNAKTAQFPRSRRGRSSFAGAFGTDSHLTSSSRTRRARMTSTNREPGQALDRV